MSRRSTPKKSRAGLFGPHWNELQPLDFDAIGERLAVSETPLAERGILHLLTAPVTMDGSKTTDDDDETPRYGTIIDFPNFLLHVLRLHVTSERPDADPVIAFDDKRLVEQFKTEFRPGSATAVKRFAEELLQARFLLDNFVIRTDSVRDTTDDDSNWVIHRPHLTGTGKNEKVTPEAAFDPSDQTRILMLQAMYQVTDSRRSYKEFLYRILYELRAQWTEDQRDLPRKAHQSHRGDGRRTSIR